MKNNSLNSSVYASDNLAQLLLKYKDQIIEVGSKIGKGILSAVGGVVQIMVSLFIAAIMLAIGAPVPMLVIFIGVIGGFIFSGFIGLFTGAIVMSIGYKLFVGWINSGTELEKV